MTLARLPRQKAAKPCSLGIRTKTSTMPLYWFSLAICFEACCTWRRSFTRSIGATTVFETAAAIPPATKSCAKDMGSKPLFFFVSDILRLDLFPCRPTQRTQTQKGQQSTVEGTLSECSLKRHHQCSPLSTLGRERAAHALEAQPQCGAELRLGPSRGRVSSLDDKMRRHRKIRSNSNSPFLWVSFMTRAVRT